MKLKINNYIYKNPKLDNFTILNFSDTHGDIKHLNLILNYLKNNKVDLILMAGDLLDRIDLNNKNFIDKVKELPKYAKTYMVLGNHDNLLLSNKLLSIKDTLNNKYIKELKSIKDLYYSTSSYEKIKINNNIDLNFVVLPNDYYDSKEDFNIAKSFLNTIENNEIDKSKFNIMLIHSPKAIVKKKKLINNNLINNMDLIIAGHTHGGLTPTLIQDTFKNHSGLFGPYYTLFDTTAYGIFKKNNSYLLVSNGVTKISKTTILKNFGYSLNNILVPEIDIITFKKDNNYDLKLINRKKYK